MLWFSGAGACFAMMILRSFASFPSPDEAWAWFLPMVVPTSGLMIAVMGADAQSKGKRVDRRYIWLSMAICGFYLVLVMVAIVPILDDSMRQLERSSLFLGPFQALVTAALGYLFVKKEDKEDEGGGG
jgi:hypothetical protein